MATQTEYNLLYGYQLRIAGLKARKEDQARIDAVQALYDALQAKINANKEGN